MPGPKSGWAMATVEKPRQGSAGGEHGEDAPRINERFEALMLDFLAFMEFERVLCVVHGVLGSDRCRRRSTYRTRFGTGDEGVNVLKRGARTPSSRISHLLPANKIFRSMERNILAGAEGIEPPTAVLETAVIPFNYAPMP